jgi:hypothetical protein
MTYQLANIRNKLVCIVKTDNDMKHFIPMVEDNTDYQAYLKWVAEGNEPEPAENE